MTKKNIKKNIGKNIKKNTVRLQLLSVLVLGIILFGTSSAMPLSYIPKVYISGLGGYDGWTGLAKADILAPFILSNDRTAYIYGQGRYGYTHQLGSNSTYTGSLALGYRQMTMLFNYPNILGAYLFTDYSRTATEHTAMDLSPGIESLGFNWDFRINGYFPLGKAKWKTEDWADNYDDYSYIIPQGHSIYDARFVFHEETGVGADAEVGRNLLIVHNMLLKGFLDGYYYHMARNDEMRGLGARLTLNPTSYLEISVNDTYDNYNHNVIMAGFRLSINKLINLINLINRYSFNGLNELEAKENLQYRLYDPIERNFSTIGSGSTIPTAGGPNHSMPEIILPDVPPGPNPGPTPPPPPVNPWHQHQTPEKDNVWFFDGFNGSNDSNDSNDFNGSSANETNPDGTYEHPYKTGYLNQQVLNNINVYTQEHGKDYADIFLNSGTYYDKEGVPLTLYIGQSIWGRMGDHKGYQQPATGNKRPLIIGSFNLSHGNHTIDSIRLQNNGEFNAGFNIANCGSVKINNSVIGTPSSGSGYNLGINMSASNVAISNSTVYGFGANGNAGINMANGGSLSITSSTIQGISPGTCYGIHADGKGENITIDHSNVSARAGGAGWNGYGVLIGADTYCPSAGAAIANNILTIRNGSNVTGAGGDGYGVLVGYYNTNNTMGPVSAIITNNHINIIGSNVTGTALTANAAGLLVGVDQWHGQQGISINPNYITITNSTLSGTANNVIGNGFGILVGVDNLDGVCSIPLSIVGNSIQIYGSHITGTASYTAAIPTRVSVDNGYGILLGCNNLSVIGGENAHITNNNIGITGGSVISGSGHITMAPSMSENCSGDGFGVLMGVNSYDVVERFFLDLSSNIITITGSRLSASGFCYAPGKERNQFGSAQGLMVGANQSPQFSQAVFFQSIDINELNTQVNLTSNTFNITTQESNCWGVYISEAGYDKNLKLNRAGNVFSHKGGSPMYDGRIYYLGRITRW